MATRAPVWSARPRPYALAPLVIEETGKEFSFSLDLPGLKKSDLRVSVRSGLLVISGRRKIKKSERGGDYFLKEEDVEYFERSCSLPAGVSARGMKARYQRGRLCVSLPKAAAGGGADAKIRVG